MEPGIFGQFMVVGSANLFLLLQLLPTTKGGRREAFSHDHGTKADPGAGSALAWAAFFRHAQLEVETDSRKFANNGH